ncbi:unnamed protein product [Spirodela intermedia]|uniref:AT-hook motif nuclear-localized protein n=1 Tax=Spirodela intermedia TaxID=51605 RepID=A0A7I8JAK2_SPIIN|nr:unnamed protein product [Spirodela intermedia]CAA6667021.1 unnamed protein product [Spirodela intermedia]
MDARGDPRMSSSEHHPGLVAGGLPSSPLPAATIHGVRLSFSPTAAGVPTADSRHAGELPLEIRPVRPRRQHVSGAGLPAAVGAASGYSSEPPAPKRRGRPPGSGKKKQLDALGSAGVGFTPHVIIVNPGEDVASKIMAFSQQSPRTICVVSAIGAISNVTLRQPATLAAPSPSRPGRFEILSLSGSFHLAEDGGAWTRTGGLSVSLAGADSRVLGGGVVGMLVAASPVQVVVASFIPEGRKPKLSQPPKLEPPPPPNPIPPPATVAASASPPSQGTSSELSDGGGGGSSGLVNLAAGQQHAYTSSASWADPGSQLNHD